MFLVEAEAGQRRHYASASALGTAIRRGEVGPRARIFHQHSNQWLPITVHPAYQRAESEWEQGSSGRLHARGWTFFPERPEESEPHLTAPRTNEVPVPMLIPGDEEPSWLRNAFRHLLQLTRPGS